jgi:hypothetical protein
MTQSDNRQIAQFLEDPRAAIQPLIRQAYHAVGGHYAALTPEPQAHPATGDSTEFIADLRRGTPDREVIRQPGSAAAAAPVAGDIVNMAAALDRAFAAFVAVQLPRDPRLVRELILRGSYVIARFRRSVSSMQITALGQADEPAVAPAPRPPL